MSTSAQSSQSPSAALSLDQAANELGTKPDCVLRLIARGALLAAIVGVKHRITPAALADFIHNGAPDFKELDSDRGWFRHDPRRPDVTLRRELAAAAEDQRPTDDQLRGAKEGTVAQPMMTFEVRRSPAIVAVAARTVGGANPWLAMFKSRPTDGRVTDDMTLLDAFIADELHAAAKRSLESAPAPFGRSPFQKLYASPEAYKDTTEWAASRVAEMSISWTRTEVIQVGPEEKPQKPVVVRYVLPIANASNEPIANRIRSVIALAF